MPTEAPPRTPESPRGRRRAASAVEVLVVVALLGILSNLAIHSALEYKRRGEAARVVADFELFRAAALEHYRNTGTWPRETRARREPPELAALLDGRLEWSHPELGIVYDWDNWVRASGAYHQPQTGVARGFSVVIPRERARFEPLLRDLAAHYEGPVVRATRNRLTFVLDPIPPESPAR